MPNDVTVFGGNVGATDLKALAGKAREAADNNPRGGAPDGSDYMNFSGKRGLYTIGKDKREIQNDELWLVNVTSFEEGWVCWKGGKSPSSRMSNIFSGTPIAQPSDTELGPFDSQKGEGWFQAKSMVVKSIDNDQQGYFKINSISGVSSLSELIGEFASRAEEGLPAWPVIYLDKEEFESQGYKNFKPIFEVHGWIDTDDLNALAEGAEIDDLVNQYEEGEPVAIDKEPEPEPEPEAKPARGRRRAKGKAA